MKVSIIDYGRGNLRSVRKAFESLGVETATVDSGDAFPDSGAVVLPGVGSFGDCARSLDERALRAPLLAWLRDGRPFLGICLGFQILFESGEESPGAQGLGFFKGNVRRFPCSELKIPHMGWNTLAPTAGARLFEGTGEAPFVYFVHSYFPEPADPSIITASCEYGIRFAAACGCGEVQAVQFHPEKSQGTGLQILRNFLSIASAVS